jgi:hypothetical protein
MMKVKDLIAMEVDIDVYDTVCDDIGVAFCGPMKLTEAGEEKFSEVLERPCKLCNYGGSVVCLVDVGEAEKDEVWKPRLKKAKNFFWSAAGYCAAEDYDRWFES